MNWTFIGAVLAALAVICGAFGAHALRASLSADDLATWHTAVLYHLVHGVALVLYGVFVRGRAARGIAGFGFFVGTILFSGSLYALALGSPRWLGLVTPIGGAALIAGWICFAWQARKT